MILNVIMIFIACCAAGAWLVTWAKLDEQKKLTKEERDRRWDEISLRQNVEKEKDAEIAYWKEANNDKIGDILFYHAECLKLAIERDALKDKLSALLCPTNNHVWKDGVCVKCGRVKDG